MYTIHGMHIHMGNRLENRTVYDIKLMDQVQLSKVPTLLFQSTNQEPSYESNSTSVGTFVESWTTCMHAMDCIHATVIINCIYVMCYIDNCYMHVIHACGKWVGEQELFSG